MYVIVSNTGNTRSWCQALEKILVTVKDCFIQVTVEFSFGPEPVWLGKQHLV